jgi:putative restriction endonuclease
MAFDPKLGFHSDFQNLNQAVVKDKRAPHKPLLVMLALSRYQAGHRRLLSFDEIEKPLTELLKEFAPAVQSINVINPFVRLANDGVWELTTHEGLPVSINPSTVKLSYLRREGICGGFTEKIFSRVDIKYSSALIQFLLDVHFPDTVHQDILDILGLEIKAISKKSRRDPAFRKEVLRAYEYRCAVCGFQAHIAGAPVGLDAAHIKWHTADGPDRVPNGMTLCSLHHKLFDRGVFSLDDRLKVIVSADATGNQSFQKMMLDYHGHNILIPGSRKYYPSDAYIEWHQEQVFQSPPRYA